MGKRLAPLTEEQPKGLIELGGRSLLARLLDGLQAAGVHETVLVVGYRQEMIRAALGPSHRGMPLRYVVNPDFEKGPRLSLWAGRAEFGRDDVVLADGDYEVALDGLLGRHPFTMCPTAGLPWIEIDFPQDLEAAEAEILPQIEPLPRH